MKTFGEKQEYLLDSQLERLAEMEVSYDPSLENLILYFLIRDERICDTIDESADIEENIEMIEYGYLEKIGEILKNVLEEERIIHERVFIDETGTKKRKLQNKLHSTMCIPESIPLLKMKLIKKLRVLLNDKDELNHLSKKENKCVILEFPYAE